MMLYASSDVWSKKGKYIYIHLRYFKIYTKAKNKVSGIETSNVEAFWGSALRNLANNFLWPNQWKVVNEFNKPVIKIACTEYVTFLYSMVSIGNEFYRDSSKQFFAVSVMSFSLPIL